MRVCEMCQKKPRRLLKVKDTVYGKGYTEYDLCEQCFQKMLKPMLDKRRDV